MHSRQISEQSFMIYFEANINERIFDEVYAVVDYINSLQHPFVKEIVPSYRAILVYFDGMSINYETIVDELKLNDFNFDRAHETVLDLVCRLLL
ncbi:carboxyltransferase domain-containing protein [Streptococcus suis]